MDFQTAVVYLAAGFVILVNLITFLCFASDKRRAKRGARRIPESTLLTLAALGGAPGAWLSMLVFRHKTRHARFAFGVPAILFGEAILLALYFILILQ
jgi:uncharacterized membrane protein YsdA (DUF1294 family)